MSEGNGNLENKSVFLFDVLRRYDHYVATTNFKVALIMSFLGVVIFGLMIRVMAIDVDQSGCGYTYYSAIIFSALTIAASLFSAINVLRSVFPNTDTHNEDESLVFFGDVADCGGGASGYAKKVKEAADEEIIDDLSQQVYAVAGIINEKFRVLKIAIKMTIYGVIPLLAISLLLIMLEGAK